VSPYSRTLLLFLALSIPGGLLGVYAGEPEARHRVATAALQGLYGLPNGAKLGMGIEELRAERPKARPMLPAYDESTSRKHGEPSPEAWIERVREDVANWDAVSVYLFEGGKCVAIAVEERIPWADLPARRETALKEYLSRFGAGFCRAVRRGRAEGFSYDAPCLQWKTQDFVVLLSPMPYVSGVAPQYGFVYIRVSVRGHGEDMGLTQYTSGTHGSLFAVIEDITRSMDLGAPTRQGKDAHLPGAAEAVGAPSATGRTPHSRGAAWLVAGILLLIGAILMALACRKSFPWLGARRR